MRGAKSNLPENRTPTGPASEKVSAPAAPLFRRIDWLTLLITSAAVWIGYYLTLAPEVTLEDSGELATGSFYAGIPHSPGYPVWTLYTWLWTVLLPFKNIAWRVALAEATSGALASGLAGLLVSRGASMMFEGVAELNAMTRRAQEAVCIVSGFVAGLLLGYNGFMWSQSVIVEVYSFGVFSFMIVLVCLLRWIYAPRDRRYLYAACFCFGVCFTNHQTLIVAAMGIEVAMAAVDPRLGRNLFLGNSIIYAVGWLLSQQHILTALEANPAVLSIFHVVGIGSLAAYIGLSRLTQAAPKEWAQDGLYATSWLVLAFMPSLGWLAGALAFTAAAGFLRLAWKGRPTDRQWLVVLFCGGCWLAGAAFYLYLPVAGMTNPPMEWGYPRTVDGFIHAFTRGQYEKTNPTDILHQPWVFGAQLMNLGRGIIEEFNWVYVLLALVPFLYFFKMRPRERAWVAGLASLYLCLGVLLLILLNPPPDRGAQQIVRVFFTASHSLIALLVGYGLALIVASMATQYPRFRARGLLGGLAAVALAFFSLAQLTQDTFFGEQAHPSLAELLGFIGRALTHSDQYALPIYAGLLLVGITLTFLAALVFARHRPPLAITLVLFALTPLYAILTHWSDNEQRDHWFGYWVGHDMFSPPFKGPDGRSLYPELTQDAILFGGTDAGRFCPTYMIFNDSFLPSRCRPPQDPGFDRRDAYIITQNALADPPYLNSVRAQYNRSRQVDPPFFAEFCRLLLRDPPYQTNLIARAVEPLDRWLARFGDHIEEWRRTSTSWFKPEDFIDLPSFAARLRPGPQQDGLSRYLYDHLGPSARKLLDARGQDQDQALRRDLARDLNRLTRQDLDARHAPASNPEDPATAHSLYQTGLFKHVALSTHLAEFLKENPRGHPLIRLNRLLLEAAYPAEIAKSPGGVYPDREIYVPSPEDLQRCYTEYQVDVRRRIELKQLEPGENVAFLPNGTMQLSGQVAIMAINALLARIIFERNPSHDIFIEEGSPIKWMYPYLTPYGIILRLNRQPPAELTPDTVQRDHQFWGQYTERLIGNWITYDTSLENLVEWVNKVYRRRDFSGFSGDRKFIRDDQAQRVFSKLRCAQAGVYSYRVGAAKTDSERLRMHAEAEFAFRQSFAFCPYNHETVLRFAQLLVNSRRFDDALLLAHTSLGLDPYNGEVIGLVHNLETWKKQEAARSSPAQNPANLEQTVRSNPSDLQAAFNLAATYLQQGQTNRAVEVLDGVLARPEAGNASALYVLAQAYSQIGDLAKVQTVLEKLVKVLPDSPEAWWNLAAFRALSGRTEDALSTLRHALELNASRIQHDPKAHDLSADLPTDPRFSSLSQNPEFQRLLPAK